MSPSASFNRSSVYLEVIEGLSKNVMIGEGDVLGMAKEIMYRGAHFLKVDRVNVWFANEEETQLTCLKAYNRKTDTFYREETLHIVQAPVYFNHIRRSKLIISENVYEEPFNVELIDNYLRPNHVQSMMEIPILSGGRFKGIVCFEQTEVPHSWVPHEQHFALALTQLLILTIEINEKNSYREKLERAIKEKSTLITEINHRVKNNLSVILALIKGEGYRVKDEYHEGLFQTLLSKVHTLSTLQHSLYDAKNYNHLALNTYLPQLVRTINDTYGYHLKVQTELSIAEITIHADAAIPVSLICNELLTNAYKYAFTHDKANKLLVELLMKGNEVAVLRIGDNGPGLPVNYQTKGTGFELINDLSDQIDGKWRVQTNEKGTTIELEFPVSSR
jgi:two-component sensor histidine kinase